jgi:cell division protein FtsB
VSRWATVYKFTWILIVAVCMVGVLFLFLPRYAKYRANKRLKAEREHYIDVETAAAKQFREYQRRLRDDPAFAERIAREEGMVMTNESIIKAVPASRTNAVKKHDR